MNNKDSNADVCLWMTLLSRSNTASGSLEVVPRLEV